MRLAPANTATIARCSIKDIDAVVIATPNHWHVSMALAALGAGKDIYLEKPVTHTLEEGPRLQAAVEASRQVVQSGAQNRSMPHFFEARDIVASGGLGKISFVETLGRIRPVSGARPGYSPFEAGSQSRRRCGPAAREKLSRLHAPGRPRTRP